MNTNKQKIISDMKWKKKDKYNSHNPPSKRKQYKMIWKKKGSGMLTPSMPQFSRNKKRKKIQIKKKISVFSSFPNVLLAEIFSFLSFQQQISQIKLVSSHFSSILSLPNACPSEFYLYGNHQAHLSSFIDLPFKSIILEVCPNEEVVKLLQQKNLSEVIVECTLRRKDLFPSLYNLPIGAIRYEGRFEAQQPLNVEFLKHFPQLYHLDILCNSIEMSQLSLFAPNLLTLSLWTASRIDQNLHSMSKLCGLTLEGIDVDCTLLQDLRLESLNLKTNDISPLREMITLTNLGIEGENQIEGLEILSKLPLLQYLTFVCKNGISSFAWLQNLNHLVELRLFVNKFQDNEFSYIKDLSSLQTFSLHLYGSSSLSGSGFNFLPISLEYLEISQVIFSKISSLSGLIQLEKLTSLDLSILDLSDIDFPCIPTLTSLTLRRIGINFQKSFPCLSNLTSLYLCRCQFSEKWFISLPIMPLKSLSIVDEEERDNLTDISVMSLKKFTTLRELTLINVNITQKCVEFLRKELPLTDIIKF